MAFYIQNRRCFCRHHHFQMVCRAHIGIASFYNFSAALLDHDFHGGAIIHIVAFWNNNLSFRDLRCIRMIHVIKTSFSNYGSHRLGDPCRSRGDNLRIFRFQQVSKVLPRLNHQVAHLKEMFTTKSLCFQHLFRYLRYS